MGAERQPKSDAAALAELAATVKALRDPGGCSWDIAQTPQSLRRHFVEEVCEVLDALDGDDAAALREELGDILIHVLFQCDMARRAGRFELGDAAADAAAKLRRRHPHVFGGARAGSDEQIETQWEAIKRAETGRNSSIKELPATLPSLAAAAALQRAAWRAGLRWEEDDAALGRADELADVPEGEREELAGRMLAALAFKVWRAGVDPESALRVAAAKFRKRVLELEAGHSAGVPLDELPPEELEKLSRKLAE